LPLSAELASRIDASGTLVPSVRVTVPYRSLIFLRGDAGWTGGILVEVVARRGDTQVGGGVESARAYVDDPAAPGDGELVCDVPLVIRGGDRVILDVEVTASGTSRRWRRELSFHPGPLARLPVGVVGVHWNLGAGDEPPRLAATDDSLAVAVYVVPRGAPPPGPAPQVELVGTVVPRASGDRMVRRARIATPEAPEDTSTTRVSWPANLLPFGRADVQLALVLDGDEAGAVPCAPLREFVNLRVPWQDDRAWRRQIGWLAGLVPDEERKRLGELAPPARAAAWRDLWTSMAQSVESGAVDLETEHLLRIVDADDRFGRFGRGALSDRGRAYIRYGEPDRIERASEEFGPDGLWEFWYYRSRRLRLAFLDRHGLGDYRLVETSSY
jgi:GWxTD domain-containing protein